MPGSVKNFIGLEGFIWWVGVVEDRSDPEQLGRVRVRCFGWHTEDKNKIPTESLPWAHPIIPVNHPAVYTPKEGDMVFGFFIDGTNGQNPAIMGIFPGKPEQKPKYENGFADPRKNFSNVPKKEADSAEAYPKSKYLKEQTTNRLSRGKTESTVIETRKKNLKKNVKSAGGVTWSEPSPSFKPVYPYNYALESESGHAFELDDTPKNERVHLAHRKGAFIEFDKDGSRIEKVQKDNYCIIMGDESIYIKGRAAITVDGNFNLKTATINIEASEINMSSDGAVKIKGSSVKIESTGSMDLKSGGAGKFTAGGRLDLKGATAGLGGATVDIPAGKVNIQGGSVGSAAGTGLKGGGAAPTAEENSEQANTAAAAKSTTANAAASANSVGTAVSISSAAAGIDPKAAPGADLLQEVQVTGKKIVQQETTLLGKIKDGITSTVKQAVNQVGQTLTAYGNEIINDFKSGVPLNTIADKVQIYADNFNQNKASIFGLDTLSQKLLFETTDQISINSYENDIEFRLDESIQEIMLSQLYNITENKLNNVLGKHIYPKTETVEIDNNFLNAEYLEILERYKAQELDALGIANDIINLQNESDTQ